MLTKRELSSRLRYYADRATEMHPEIFRGLMIDVLREAADALDAVKTPLVNDAIITPNKPATLFGVPVVESKFIPEGTIALIQPSMRKVDFNLTKADDGTFIGTATHDVDLSAANAIVFNALSKLPKGDDTE